MEEESRRKHSIMIPEQTEDDLKEKDGSGIFGKQYIEEFGEPEMVIEAIGEGDVVLEN